MSTRSSLRSLARLLFLLGGIILILGAVPDIGVVLRGILDFAPHIPSLGSIAAVLIDLVAGVVALAGIAQVSNPVWSIILLILGFLAGGLGGIIVIVGAIIALVATFI